MIQLNNNDDDNNEVSDYNEDRKKSNKLKVKRVISR